MTVDNQLIFAAFMGACAMAAINLAVQDQIAYADSHEKETCKDKGDMTAMMARLPGEAHDVEMCVFSRKFGDPAWVPQMGDVTLTGAGIKGMPGLELQLKYVRDECHRLAKQLKQQC